MASYYVANRNLEDAYVYVADRKRIAVEEYPFWKQYKEIVVSDWASLVRMFTDAFWESCFHDFREELMRHWASRRDIKDRIKFDELLWQKSIEPKNYPAGSF